MPAAGSAVAGKRCRVPGRLQRRCRGAADEMDRNRGLSGGNRVDRDAVAGRVDPRCGAGGVATHDFSVESGDQGRRARVEPGVGGQRLIPDAGRREEAKGGAASFPPVLPLRLLPARRGSSSTWGVPAVLAGGRTTTGLGAWSGTGAAGVTTGGGATWVGHARCRARRSGRPWCGARRKPWSIWRDAWLRDAPCRRPRPAGRRPPWRIGQSRGRR